MVMTAQLASQVVSDHETARLKKEARSGGTVDLNRETGTDT